MLAMMFCSHLLIFVYYRQVIKELLLGDDPEPPEESAPLPEEVLPEPEGMFAPVTSCCRSLTKFMKSCSSSLGKVLKNAGKLMWKGLKIFLFCLSSLIMLDLPVWFYQVRYKKQFDSEYNQILAFILGWIAILTFIPIFLTNCVYIISV